MGRQDEPLASLKGSELWAPVSKVVYTTIRMIFNRIQNLRPILGDHSIYFGLQLA